jgi:putative two-component system response regulator
MPIIRKSRGNGVEDIQNVFLQSMADYMEHPGGITNGHLGRTRRYIELLLEMLENAGYYDDEISTWNREYFLRSSLLHDLGKFFIRDSILLKPGKLTKDEFEEMKTHTLSGLHMIEEMETAAADLFLQYAKIFIGTHHEWWDGSGYPYGLKGREIPLQGRLMAIVDVYDALISERPYKKAYSHEEAVRIIAEGRGTHFDPALVDLFMSGQQRFRGFAA